MTMTFIHNTLIWNGSNLITLRSRVEIFCFERNFSNAYFQTTGPRSESGESAIAGFIYHTRTKVSELQDVQAGIRTVQQFG